MKIYTKKGDRGNTKLLGGTPVSKAHIKVDAYGEVDELNAHLAHLKDELRSIYFNEIYTTMLHRINVQLFDLGSLLAVDNSKYKGKLNQIKDDDIEELEEGIDDMEEGLDSLKNFILPGGHPLISLCHICRTVCRRAERKVVLLSEQENLNSIYIKYLNRLSDYLFTLARFIAVELDVEEEKWMS
ncbi:cob(I)yrinic acid a,c-diamide adenosyltransferase [Membranihabitans marinus]|uniref:cob(I)yrinic acid a,c-diamide adenosyltransferase n=1 Tax=Membranihabitans marinus TaxID=1227546 RepID=UPI001F01701F|nr:cob(I)yrinic acid a,c-diamide adenosyltransferase [Membranihabitans marinus]